MQIWQFLFIHGQEAIWKQIIQVLDVYVNFYVESDFDHIHDVLPNFIYGYPPNWEHQMLLLQSFPFWA